MTNRFRRLAVLSALLSAAVFAVPSCSEPVNGGTDSNTHWLATCAKDADCGGLNCLCGACTKACTGDSACDGLGSGASCMTANCSTVSGKACGLSCSNDGDCTHKNPELYCRAGQCAAVPILDAGSSAVQCPTTHVDGASCSGPDGVCWTSCVQGFKSEFVCSGGHWVAGKGLFPCGDGGVITVDGGSPRGRPTTDAGSDICTPNPDGGPELCGSSAPYKFIEWTAEGCVPLCTCNGAHGVNCYPLTDMARCMKDHESCRSKVDGTCSSNSDCALVSTHCCACGPQTQQDFSAVNIAAAPEWHAAVCNQSNTCDDPCLATTMPRDLIAICAKQGEVGQCKVMDITAYAACTKNEDCLLERLNCCDCAEIIDENQAVGVNGLGHALWLSSNICDPALCPSGSVACTPDAGLGQVGTVGAECNTSAGYCVAVNNL